MRRYWMFGVLMALIAIIIMIMYYIYTVFLDGNKDFIISEMADIAVKNGVNTFAPTIITSKSEEKVSPNATLVIKRHYQKCGHTTKRYEEIPKEFVNMNEQEIKKEFSNWKLKGFSAKEVVIQKEEEGICDEHFILRNKDGVIAIYIEKDDGNEELKEKTEIAVKYLTDEDIKNLEKGIIAIGKEKLNSTLEDFE